MGTHAAEHPGLVGHVEASREHNADLSGCCCLSSPLPGAGLPGEGSGSPQTCPPSPSSPLPLLERKEEPKMKLKHNSIRSGSRIKSSALIVRWQALPAPQQTQCYQGTEGRFVCTGPASCRVRPACPGPGSTGAHDRDWGSRGCQCLSTTAGPPSVSPQLGQLVQVPPSVTTKLMLWEDRARGRCLSAGTLTSPSPLGAPRVPAHPRGDPAGMGAEPPALQIARSCSCQSWVPTALSTRSCPTEPQITSRIPHPTPHIPHPASRIPHLASRFDLRPLPARALAVPWRLGLLGWLLWGQHCLASLSLYTPVIFNSAYANPKSGMSSGPGPRGNGHGANFLPFLPLFLYNIQQRFSSTA